MNTIKLTRENLHEISASPGKAGFTRKQIELLGFTWPPKKGWLTSLIGKEISEEIYAAAKGAGRKKWENAPKPEPKIPMLEQLVRAKVEIETLRRWIKENGEHTDACTYDILRELCDGCRCKRMPATNSRPCEART